MRWTRRSFDQTRLSTRKNREGGAGVNDAERLRVDPAVRRVVGEAVAAVPLGAQSPVAALLQEKMDGLDAQNQTFVVNMDLRF